MKKTLSTFNLLSLTHGTNRGFTLVETLVAIFILMLTIGALLTLTAGGFFSIRYAKNDIVATNLLQESLEYVRNTRDTAAQATPTSTWTQWLDTMKTACGSIGCRVNPYAKTTPPIEACTSAAQCKNAYLNYYSDKGFYGYYAGDFGASKQQKTTFVRTITMKTTSDTDPQLIVTATISWKNGTNDKSVSQSIVLTKWNLQ